MLVLVGSQNRSKKVRVDWCKEILEKTIAVLQKTLDGAYEPKTKQQSTVWVFEPEPNPTKVVCGKIISKQMVDCFFWKTANVATFPFELEGRSILSSTPQFVCLKSSEKFEQEKTNHCSPGQT